MMKGKKFFTLLLAAVTTFTALFSVACGGDSVCSQHSYKEVKKVAASCEKEGVRAHYECSVCGEVFTLESGVYVQRTREELAIPATGHSYGEVVDERFFVSEATEDSPEVYNKSCVCGKTNGETFLHGETLSYYSSLDKAGYMPTSLTVTLYDAENSVYGFTWNSVNKPARPLLRYKKASSAGYTEKLARVSECSTKTYAASGDASAKYYVMKTEAVLEDGENYIYTVLDKYVGAETEQANFRARNVKSDSFTFAHVSDSQVAGDLSAGGENTGKQFGAVLRAISDDGTDFIVHTGDVVEYSLYESYWRNMLDKNFAALSQIPVMAISGNHETTYRNGSNETFKHFNYKIPSQSSTSLGFYYSFVYGNAKFIMLNTVQTTTDALSAEQLNWLKTELSGDYRWKIVAMHVPVYSVGKWGADPSKNAQSNNLKAQLAKLFAASGVDLVLQGHDHCVSRTFPVNEKLNFQTEENFQAVDGVEYSVNPQGTIYLMNGPAGDQSGEGKMISGANDAKKYKYASGSNSRSYAEIQVSDNKVTVTVKYVNESGSIKNDYHKWGIIKNAA